MVSITPSQEHSAKQIKNIRKQFIMEIVFDKDADAVYIEFSSGDFASSKKMDDNTILDLDEKGNILGIELLSVSKRIPNDFLSEVSVKNLAC